MSNFLFKVFEHLVSKFDAEAEQKFIKELIPRYASGNVLAQQGRFAKTDIDKLSFISSYFHGNIRARLGRIITVTDVERKRKEVTSYVF